MQTGTDVGTDPRDRDEWRRPWTDDDGTAAEVPAPTTPILVGPSADDRVAGEATARDETTREIGIARPASPQPPPPAWDEKHHGPGSPTGSIRPPDIIGTVEPPTASRRSR